MKIYHYHFIYKVLSSLISIAIVLFGFFNPIMLMLVPFVLVLSITFNLWTFFDTTTVSIKEDIVKIKVRNRLFSTNYRFHKSNVLRVKVIQQGFINKTGTGSLNGIPIGSVAAFDNLQSSTKAYKKSMIAVQTKKRVIRIGKTFNDKEILMAYKFLKSNISLNN